MATKKKKSTRKLNDKMYAILSGKGHRVVARARKLSTARRRASALEKRGSKNVTIRRGGKTFPLARTSKRRSSKKRASRRRVSKKRTSKRRSSRRASKRTSKRRSKRTSKRRSKRASKRRSKRASKRRTSRRR
jgi:hypothetical protein